ncbi:MAG: tryptophan-rich sensory protein [Phycisphaerae bacterium]|nr:tryptophan-rich sensory protein [Gemmatimonadaceae bacterium]
MHANSPSYIKPAQRSYPLKLGALGLLFLMTAVAAAGGSIASISAPDFYLALNRPSWAPPPSLFGPAWTVLYLLMTVAAWTVVRVDGWQAAKPKIVLYGLQLVANGIWTWLFFGLHSGAIAFAEILVMWALIAATIVAFWRTHVLAGVLLLPYLAWVSFAMALTWSVWQANPGVL